MASCRHITSRDNPLLRQMRQWAQDAGAARDAGRAWIEGEHLCSAAQRRGLRARQAVWSESAWASAALRELAAGVDERIVVPDVLFARLSTLPSPAGVAFIIDIPSRVWPDRDAPAVVLDRLQDAGNVGSILRSAAALGFAQVWALKGTAGLWSPKVLRAAMGAHFGLHLVEGLSAADLAGCACPLVATSSHARDELPQVRLPQPCSWVFGHEGQGVCAEVLQHCALTLRIPQPGGEESLNVAAAAAVCLYETRRQQLQHLPGLSRGSQKINRSGRRSRRMVVAISSIDLWVEDSQAMPQRRIRLSAAFTSRRQFSSEA
jgi:TrmH family RNA methyltransferase